MENGTAVVRAAEAVLQRKEKIEAAIRDGVSELSGLIAARLETERAFRRAEAAAAIGEPAVDLPKAKKAAEAARAALEQASLRLNGFRSALGEMGDEFVRKYDEVAAEVPRHNARVVKAFTEEWNSAAAIWRLVLGRRAAIEAVLGVSMELSEPAPAAVELAADVSRPAETRAALEQALKDIASAKKAAERPLNAGSSYNPAGIFKLTKDAWGLPQGTLVVEASYTPGRLAQILDLGYARPILDRDQIPGVNAAAAKADAIEKARAAKELAESEARLHSNTGKETTRRPDLEAELNWKPTQADLDKIERNNELIRNRSIGPSDPEFAGR